MERGLHCGRGGELDGRVGGAVHRASRATRSRTGSKTQRESGLRHVVATPDVYMVPRTDGLILGASSEEAGLDATPRAGVVLELMRDGWFLLPGLEELAFDKTVVGFRPAFPDHLPAIGPTHLEGLWVATGHFRKGITLAPATAKLVVDSVSMGHVPAEFSWLDVNRFEGARSAACG